MTAFDQASVLLAGSKADRAGGLTANGGIRHIVVLGGDSGIDQLHQISNGVVASSCVSGSLGQGDDTAVSNVGLEDVITLVRDRHCLGSNLLREISGQEFIKGKASLGLIAGKTRRSAVLSICRSPLTLGNHMVNREVFCGTAV